MGIIKFKVPTRAANTLTHMGIQTFNALMLRDLIKDLIELKKSLPTDQKQIELAISYAKECIDEKHMYLKFHGD